MKPTWTGGEKDLLRKLCGPDVPFAKIRAAFPDKSESSVRYKIKNMGLECSWSRKYWDDAEKKAFAEDWENPDISNASLRKKYKNRTDAALEHMAERLGLPARERDFAYLSISDIVSEMGVSKDRVRGWIRKGLKYKKSKIRTVTYLVDPDDLLAYLEAHPDCYDASRISDYLFAEEPEWLKEKRRADRTGYKPKAALAETYSDSEKKTIEMLFKAGKSNGEIADRTGRTAYGIERVLCSMGLSRKRYNQYELDYIRENAGKIHISEIAANLPLRTKKGIIAKCEQLGIKYSLKSNK